MPRRRPTPELTNSHDRWLVSYADFITLLFACFVVMYSTSVVNRGSFRALSDSIEHAFGLPFPSSSAAAESRGSADSAAPPLQAAADASAGTTSADGADALAGLSAPTRRLLRSLDDSVGDLVPAAAEVVTPDSAYVDIEIPAELLFPSGARSLLADAIPLLRRIAESLRESRSEIVVQGHTDDQPIRNGRFPSNWELSASRAAAVVRVLQSEGVDPGRMSVQGYADTRPVESNATDDGRSRNRRVVIRVRRALGDATVADEGAAPASGRAGAPADG